MTTKAEEFVTLLESLPEYREAFDVSGFFGLAGEVLPRVMIREPKKADEDAAVTSAHKYLETLDHQDVDVLEDAKSIELLFRVCRDPEKPSYPRFPGPEWMRKNLTGWHVAKLMALVCSVQENASKQGEAADAT